MDKAIVALWGARRFVFSDLVHSSRKVPVDAVRDHVDILGLVVPPARPPNANPSYSLLLLAAFARARLSSVSAVHYTEWMMHSSIAQHVACNIDTLLAPEAPVSKTLFECRLTMIVECVDTCDAVDQNFKSMVHEIVAVSRMPFEYVRAMCAISRGDGKEEHVGTLSEWGRNDARCSPLFPMRAVHAFLAEHPSARDVVQSVFWPEMGLGE